jgi:hypothetical protein
MQQGFEGGVAGSLQRYLQTGLAHHAQLRQLGKVLTWQFGNQDHCYHQLQLIDLPQTPVSRHVGCCCWCCWCFLPGVDRLTLGQLQQVHSWLLSVQSVEAAEGAINMWHEVPPKRFEAASQHELVLAECRLHLGRLLLREACGQTVPALTVDRPVKDAEAGPSSNAQDDKAAAAPSSKTSNSSWAQVAASTAPTAAGGSKGSAAADKLLPTAFLQHLPDVLAAHPERQEQVDRALQMLAAAAAGFSAADRSPGVVEALSWSLAAKGLGSVTTSHHQVSCSCNHVSVYSIGGVQLQLQFCEGTDMLDACCVLCL